MLQKTDQSFQQKDINGCLAMLAEDFQGTDIDGHHSDKVGTKRSLIRVFSPNPLIIQSSAIKSEVVSVASSGSHANVIYHEHLITAIVGQITHQKHILTLDTLRRSTWTRTKHGWCETSETQVTSRITRDGVLQDMKDKK